MQRQAVQLPRASINRLCRQFRVKELSLFGSGARGELAPGSELDFLVEFLPDANAGYIELFQLQDELARIVRRKVDLVSKGGLRPPLRQEVLDHREVIYAS